MAHIFLLDSKASDSTYSLLGVIGTSHFNGQNKHLLTLFLNITCPFPPVNLLLSGFGDQFIVFEWQLMLW